MTIRFARHTRAIVCSAAICVIASAHMLASGAWKPTSGAIVSRRNPSMIELRDGRIATIGSFGGWDESWKALDLYDPRTNTWTRGASLTYMRNDPTLITLGDGRLAVSSGMSEGGTGIPVTEIYDPATDAWTMVQPTAELGTFGAASASLGQDRVLVTGGFLTLEYQGPARPPFSIRRPPKADAPRRCSPLAPTTAWFDSTTHTCSRSAGIRRIR